VGEQGPGSMRMESEGREEAPIVLSDSDDEENGCCGPSRCCAHQGQTEQRHRGRREAWGLGPLFGPWGVFVFGREGRCRECEPAYHSGLPEPALNQAPSQQTLSEENVPSPLLPPPVTSAREGRSNAVLPLASPHTSHSAHGSRLRAGAGPGPGCAPGHGRCTGSFSPLPMWAPPAGGTPGAAQGAGVRVGFRARLRGQA